MNLENLTNLEKTGKIEKENYSLESIGKKYRMASSRCRAAANLLKTNDNDEGIYISAYFELYASFRSLCEIMLSLCGYRVIKGRGHHQIAISSIAITLDYEEIKAPYLRLQKLGRRRDKMEYGGEYDVSIKDMESMLNDVEFIQEKVNIEITKKQNNQSPL